MKLLTAIDLDDHWDRVTADPDDFPSFAIGARFAGVERVLDLAEQAIPRFQADAISEAHIDLAKYREIYEPKDLEDWRGRLATELRSTIPAAFIASCIFHLAGAHEQSIRDLARYVLRRQGNPLNQKAERSPWGILQQLLGPAALGDADVKSGIRSLKLVRDALAHAGGYLYGEPDDRRSHLQNVIDNELGVTVEIDRIVATGRFVRISMSAAVQHLNLLMHGVASALPLKNAP